jgi:hypothetical protein
VVGHVGGVGGSVPGVWWCVDGPRGLVVQCEGLWGGTREQEGVVLVPGSGS